MPQIDKILNKIIDEIKRKLFSNSYWIEKEQQLANILIRSLQMVLPSYLVVEDCSLLTGMDEKICEFATSEPDICSEKSAATVDGAFVDDHEDENEDVFGLTTEAKRDEFKLGQTIANMIKVATDLSVIALKKEITSKRLLFMA